jgi:hypothetical protein
MVDSRSNFRRAIGLDLASGYNSVLDGRGYVASAEVTA